MDLKPRKVCYLIYNKAEDNYELYINTQKFSAVIEDWEYTDNLESNLCYVYDLYNRDKDTCKEKGYLHYSLLLRINELINLGYIYLGVVARTEKQEYAING